MTLLKKLLAVLALLCGTAAFAAVDVNSATAADLDSVKGIGPGMSTRILDERKKGKFKNWDDLITRVKGVGAKNAAKFSASGMTVDGAGYAGAAAPAAKPAKAGGATAAQGASGSVPPIATKPAAAAAPAATAPAAKPAAAPKS